MLQCQNCGQINTQTSNFCRFCGTKFAAVQFSTFANVAAVNNFEYAPPRPYSWKTDEFPIPPPKIQPKPTKTKTIAQVQPLGEFKTRPDLHNQNLQLHQAAPISAGYHCPRCSSQLFPRVVRQISTGGWIVFAVLLVTFFPLFWLGFFIKDEVRLCPVCNYKFN